MKKIGHLNFWTSLTWCIILIAFVYEAIYVIASLVMKNLI